jgi:hypothetical protein
MRIKNMAGAAPFDHTGALSNTTSLHDVNRAAPPYFEGALSILGDPSK